MPKHTWTLSVNTDAGSLSSLQQIIYGSTEQNIGANATGITGLAIGAQDVEEVDIVVTVANIKSFSMKCTTDVRVRINSETVPAQEFNFTKAEGLAWNNVNLPQSTSNPLTTNITKLFIFNKGTVDGVTPTTGLATGYFKAGFLLGQESLFS